MSGNGQFLVTQHSTRGPAADGLLPLKKAKRSLTWSHGREKYDNLVFISFLFQIITFHNKLRAQKKFSTGDGK